VRFGERWRPILGAWLAKRNGSALDILPSCWDTSGNPKGQSRHRFQTWPSIESWVGLEHWRTLDMFEYPSTANGGASWPLK